jgi:hypothetical protein
LRTITTTTTTAAAATTAPTIGNSTVPTANFNDGTGCTCKWLYFYDKTTTHCEVIPLPKDCTVMGTGTNCTALDPNAFCGPGQPAAEFNDGTNCCCKVRITQKARRL